MTIGEVVKWKRLTHPNLAPFLGITLDPLQFISAWVSGLTLGTYLLANPNTNRPALVSVPLFLHPATLTPLKAVWYRGWPQLPPFL